MKSLLVVTGGCLAAVSAMGAVDPAPIVAVGLYKNGNAVLTRRVTPENGAALVEIPSCLPSYGTLWHTAKRPVTVTTVREPRKVKVTFRADSRLGALLAEAEKNAGLSVRMSETGHEKKDASDAIFTVSGERQESDDEREPVYRIRLASGSVVTLPKSLVVASTGISDLATGREANARFWKFEGSGEPFSIRYLTGGATWAPSYLLSFGKDARADLFMNAEIRNEIADWQDAEVSLISGFPSVRYAGVGALVGDRGLAAFMQEVAAAEGDEDLGRNWNRYGVMRQKVGMMTQGGIDSVCCYAAEEQSPEAYQASNAGAGAGSDIHYRPVGRLSLQKNATVALPLGARKTDFKRIVDWEIADRRDYWGRLQRNDGGNGEQTLWDSVKFKNPFDFPLSTGAIEITEDGRIVGQAQCAWTNPGDETLVKITKALSVKGRCEEESDGKGVRGKVSSLAPDERFRYNDHDYRKETITAKIRVQNFRREPASLNVKKVFSGELVESDVQPTKTRNLPVRDGRVNVERELAWEFDLKPGETKEIKIVHWLWVRM